jgi:hypothetical protein
MTGTEIERDAESSADDHKPYWVDGPCPAWCDRDHPECRDHMSISWMCFVLLTTEDPVVDGKRADGRLDYHPKELELWQSPETVETPNRVILLFS